MVACAVRCQLLAAVLVALTSCAGTSQPGAPQAGAAGPGAAALPLAGSLPPLPVDREASAVIVKELKGRDALLRSDGAEPVGDALKLAPEAAAPAWGIWRFYAGLEYLQSAEVVMAVDVGAEAYIALADYGKGAWVFDGPLSAGKSIALDDASHKSPAVRTAIEAAGAELRFLPPYSPDFNPIEKAFAKLKALLRKAAERTVDGLWQTIGVLIDIFTPTECANFFTAAGYEPE